MRRMMWLMFSLTALPAWFLVIFNIWLVCIGGWVDFATLWFDNWGKHEWLTNVALPGNIISPVVWMTYIPVFFVLNAFALKKILLGGQPSTYEYIGYFNVFTVMICWASSFIYMALSAYPAVIIVLVAKWISGIEKQTVLPPLRSSSLKPVIFISFTTFIMALALFCYCRHFEDSIENQKYTAHDQYNIRAEKLISFPQVQFAFGKNITIDSESKSASLKIDSFLLKPALSFIDDSNGKLQIKNFKVKYGPYNIESSNIQSRTDNRVSGFALNNLLAINIEIHRQDGSFLNLDKIKAGHIQSNYIDGLIKGNVSEKISDSDFSLRFIDFSNMHLNIVPDEIITFIKDGGFSIKHYSGISDISLRLINASNSRPDSTLSINNIEDKSRYTFSDMMKGCGLNPLDCSYDFYVEMSDNLHSNIFVNLYQKENSFVLNLRSKASINFDLLSSFQVNEFLNDPLIWLPQVRFDDLVTIDLQGGKLLSNISPRELSPLYSEASESQEHSVPFNWFLIGSLLNWCDNNSKFDEFGTFTINTKGESIVDTLKQDDPDITYQHDRHGYKQVLKEIRLSR